MTPTLTPIRGATGFLLDAPAAAALGRAIADGCPADITSAWRSDSDQLRLIALHKADPARYAFALPPDQSDHCKGRAIDTGNAAGTGPMQRWLIAHPDYGFLQTALPPEPWHFGYLLDHDQHTQEDDMAYELTDRARDDQDAYATGLLLASQGRVEQMVYQLAHQAPPTDDDAAEIAALVLAGLTPDKIAAAIPPTLAKQVVDELGKQITS